MATIERTYNVPLRREWLNAPMYKRAKKASAALKEYLAKHMKTDDVRVGPNLNMRIWENGIRNPPHHVKVTAVKGDDGVCRVELFGHKFVQKKKVVKTPKASGMAGKLQEKMQAIKKPAKEDKKADDKKEEKSAKEEKKPDEKSVPKSDVKPASAEKNTEKKPEAPKAEPKDNKPTADKPAEKPEQ